MVFYIYTGARYLLILSVSQNAWQPDTRITESLKIINTKIRSTH